MKRVNNMEKKKEPKTEEVEIYGKVVGDEDEEESK